MSDSLLTEVRGRVLLITLNRPDARNAIDSAIGVGLLEAAQRLDDDPELTIGVINGNGPGFCSGMDLKAFAKEGQPKGIIPFFVKGAKKPLIAALEGFAMAGGLEIALTCDLIVAGRSTKLGLSETKVGLFPAGGALARLPRVLPQPVATEMIFTGDPITAEEAHRYGMVRHLTDDGGAVDRAIELAEKISRNAPLALAASKQVLREAQGLTEKAFWQMQKPYAVQVFSSDDAKEGGRAFAERREPRWSGR